MSQLAPQRGDVGAGWRWKLDTIADQLAPASTDTTRIYTRIVDRMTEDPARFLEAMLTAQVSV